MAGNRGQPDRCRQLPQQQIAEQQPSGRRRRHPGDDVTRPFAQPGALQQPDDRQDDPRRADIAIGVEGLAKGGDHRQRGEPGSKPAGQRCGNDDEQRIPTQRKTDDDDADADKRPHGFPAFPGKCRFFVIARQT